MTNKIRRFYFFSILILLMTCEESPLIIKFDSPAEMWEETFPLGNGRLGAMPNGGILKEKIILNEETMWKGSEWDPANSEAKDWLPKIRQKLIEGDNIAAQELTQIHFTCSGGGGTNPKYGNYQTLGSFQIDFSDMNFSGNSVSNYERYLSINDAISKTSFNFEYDGKKATFTREYFVSLPENVIVIYLKTENAPLKFKFLLYREERSEIEEKENIIEQKIDIIEKNELQKEQNSSQETSQYERSPKREEKLSDSPIIIEKEKEKEKEKIEENEEKKEEIKSTYILNYSRKKEELKKLSTDTKLKKAENCSYMLDIKLIPKNKTSENCDKTKGETPMAPEYFLVIYCHEIAAFSFDEFYERIYTLEDLCKENRYFRIFESNDEAKILIDEFITMNKNDPKKILF